MIKSDAVLATSSAIAITQVLLGMPVDDHELVDAFTRLPSPLAHRMVRYLGLFATQSKPAHPGQIVDAHHLTVARKLVSGAARLLTAWPANLNDLMSCIQQSASNSPSVRRTFSPLYRVLYDDLRNPDFQFLRDAFERYLSEHWWGLVCRRNKLMTNKTIASHPQLTLKQTAVAAGTKPSVVRHLMQVDWIGARSTLLPSGRQARSIHERGVEHLRIAASGALSLQGAAQLLALPERRLRQLLDADVIRALISRKRNLSTASWLISRSDVEELHFKPLISSDGKVLSVRHVLRYWGLTNDEVFSLVAAIKSGLLTAWSKDDTLVPLGLVQLNEDETRRWLKDHRGRTVLDLSVDQAARQLRVKQQVAYDLVNHGFLGIRHGKTRGQRISGNEIAAFKKTYLSLAELARATHKSPRKLLKEIAAAPVTGPAIDGTRQYFFRRADLDPDCYFHLASVE